MSAPQEQGPSTLDASGAAEVGVSEEHFAWAEELNNPDAASYVAERDLSVKDSVDLLHGGLRRHRRRKKHGHHGGALPEQPAVLSADFALFHQDESHGGSLDLGVHSTWCWHNLLNRIYVGVGTSGYRTITDVTRGASSVGD